MLEALQPKDLHGAAEALGVHPFEVVRLVVLRGGSLAGPTLSPAVLDELRAFGEIEDWWSDADLPDDENTRRAAVRGVLDALLQRELVGDATTRLDNLWRGLDGEAREAAEQAVMILMDLGLLVSLAAPSGVRVSLHPEGLDTVKGVVSRGKAPPELAAVWGG